MSQKNKKQQNNQALKLPADIPSKAKIYTLRTVTVMLPFLLLVILEISLRLFGYGVNSELFVDMRGEYKEYKQANRFVAVRYFRNAKSVPSPSTDLFLKKKPDNGYRIFVLGGSSAAGYPYGENVMFSRILNGWLSASYPDKNIEIVNTAMPAVNSYAMLNFIDEILENEPDLILVYAGHNEYYGALGIGSSVTFGSYPVLIYLQLKLQKLKVFQLFQDAIYQISSFFSEAKSTGDATLMERMVEEQSIAYNSDLYKAGISQFETNLAQIIKRVQNHNVKIVISELVSNTGNQHPFVSVPGEYDASKVYDQADAQLKRQNYDSAKALFYTAKDYDALRFRAPESFNQLINKLSDEYNFQVVHLKQSFENKSANGIIGDELMLEHLHPNEDGYVLMAKAFFKVITENNFISAQIHKIHISENKNDLGITSLDSSYAALRVYILKGGWPFKPKSAPNNAMTNFTPKNKVDSVAVKVWKDDNFTLERGHVEMAEYFNSHKRPDLAFNEYRALTRLTPHNSSPYLKAAEILINYQKYNEALPFLKGSLRVSGNYYAEKWLGQIYLNLNDVHQSLGYLESAYGKKQNDTQLLYNYAGALFMEKNYSLSLEILKRLEKENAEFPGLQKLKNHVETILKTND